MGLPTRKRVRLERHDYSQKGAYFITICTQDKRNLFGYVGADSISARMIANDAGKMVDEALSEIFAKLKNVFLDKYIIMPNHMHMIMTISLDHTMDETRADMESAPTMNGTIEAKFSTPAIADIVQSLKRYTTIKYIAGVKSGIYPVFDKRIWQRSYHDHIIRNETDYLRIAQYIEENPARWEKDCYFIK